MIATAVSSHAELNAYGGAHTITDLRIEQVLKGDVVSGDTLRVYTMGGVVGNVHQVIFGAPLFRDGQRYLVMTEADKNGDQTTVGLALGKFALISDLAGRVIATHDDFDMVGFNSNLDPYVDQPRDATRFVNYINAVVSDGNRANAPVDYMLEQRDLVLPRATTEGHTPTTFATIVSYLGLQGGIYRWVSPSASLRTNGTQPGLDGPGAASNGCAAWTNDPNSNVNYSIAGTTTASGGLQHADGTNTVLFNDPNGELPDSFPGGVGGVTATSGTHSLPDGSGTANSIAEVDVVVSNTFSPAQQTCLNVVLTHELGHTLGFRHSDKNADDSAACAAPAECSSSAVMTSVTQCAFSSNLQTYDQHAVATVYGSGVPCTNPSISTQPQSTTITQGNSTILSVSAAGTSPTFQWYIGNPGNISSPINGATQTSVSVSPTTTTTYFVRVSGCSTFVDSNAVTVTVNPVQCTNPGISGQPQNATITQGNSQLLSVTATGTSPTYQWYIGNPGNISSPINGATSSSVNVSPTTTTTYFVRVSGCSTFVDSSAATVTVNPVQCQNPQITQQPVGSSIITGGSTQLFVGATGTALTYQWFIGTSGDTSNPIPGATGASVSVSPTTTTNYWVRVSGQCGTPVNSIAVTVTVSSQCTSPTISNAQANPSSIQPGQSSTLSATVGGSVAGTQWYVGTPPDKSNPVPTIGPTVSVSPTQNTNYWLQATSSCGAAATNSTVVTVSVGTSCTKPTMTQPANQNVTSGLSATLTVSAAGTATLHYQWFKGATGVRTTPVGTDSATFTTPAITAVSQFWVEVTNSCGTAQSGTITITPTLSRYRAVRR